MFLHSYWALLVTFASQINKQKIFLTVSSYLLCLCGLMKFLICDFECHSNVYSGLSCLLFGMLHTHGKKFVHFYLRRLKNLKNSDNLFYEWLLLILDRWVNVHNIKHQQYTVSQCKLYYFNSKLDGENPFVH